MNKRCLVGGIPLAFFLVMADSLHAQTWTQAMMPSNNLSWEAVASSADGSHLVAVAQSTGSFDKGPLYTSADSGVTWVSNTLSQQTWLAVSSSADGTMLASAASDAPIFVSTNTGVSWTNAPPFKEWHALASSSDGTQLVAADYTGDIYTSTNSGSVWTLATNLPATYWQSLASSADGSKLMAAAAANPTKSAVYTSLDSGNTWTSNTFPNANPNWTWRAVACSAGGNIMAAAVGGFNAIRGPIFVSTNSGTNWVMSYAPVLAWTSIAASADGEKMIASALSANGNNPASNSVFTSSDFGMTWQSNTIPAEYWTSVACSADGSRLIAAAGYSTAWSGGIWTAQTTPEPKLNIQSWSNNLKISWVLPSTNFVLQESSDLDPTNWTAPTNTPVLNLNNLENQVVLPAPASNAFYRLISK